MKAIVGSALALLFVLTSPPLAASESTSTTVQEDLDQLLEWFSGRFDNFQQVRQQEAAEEPVEEPHGRIHSIFAPIEFPELGEHIFYVQQYSKDNPRNVYRQRFYSFTADEEENAVRLEIYVPPDPSALFDLHKEPHKLRGLKVADMTYYPGCDVLWTRNQRGEADDHFVGSVPKGACTVVSSRSGKTLVVMDDLFLDEDEIWIQDRAEDSDGNWVYGHKGGIPHKLTKARTFICWAATKDEDGEWQASRGLEFHDQGAQLRLAPDKGGIYSAQLFQTTYKGENTVDVLELAIREDGKEKSIAYSWTSPDADRIGINLRYLQVGCTREGHGGASA